MSLREKQLWVSLVVGAVVWGGYFSRAVPVLLDPAHLHPARTIGLAFVIALAVFIVAEAVLAGVVAWFQRRHRPAQDQALTEAGLIAGQAALWLLSGLVILGLVGLFAVGAGMESGVSLPLPAGAGTGLALLGNLLLFALIVSEGVRTVLTLLLVRRPR